MAVSTVQWLTVFLRCDGLETCECGSTWAELSPTRGEHTAAGESSMMRGARQRHVVGCVSLGTLLLLLRETLTFPARAIRSKLFLPFVIQRKREALIEHVRERKKGLDHCQWHRKERIFHSSTFNLPLESALIRKSEKSKALNLWSTEAETSDHWFLLTHSRRGSNWQKSRQLKNRSKEELTRKERVCFENNEDTNYHKNHGKLLRKTQRNKGSKTLVNSFISNLLLSD